MRGISKQLQRRLAVVVQSFRLLVIAANEGKVVFVLEKSYCCCLS